MVFIYFNKSLLLNKHGLPRDEHARPALDLEITKRLSPEDVLQRNALCPLLDKHPDTQLGGNGRLGVLDVFPDPAQLVGGGLEVAAGREQFGGEGRDLSPGPPEEGRRKPGHSEVLG